MAQIPKPAKLTKGVNSSKEMNARIAVEDKMTKIAMVSCPPEEWSDNRKAIFYWLYDALEPTGFLSILDKPTFFQACIIIDRLDELDRLIDKNGVDSKELRIARSDYFKQYLAVCAEMCLSPQARAKLGTLVASKAKEEDALLSALGGDVDAK